MNLNAGQILDGKYRIVRVLGVGGMGAVYEGENTRIHRKVAIKVLHASVAGKEDIVQRFEREAQAAGRIGSQHIVEVLDLGNLPTGERYMVMEYMDGDPLTKRIKVKGRLSPAEMAPILLQLLEGLGGAHAAGIVHRDLKPDNIFLIRRHNQDFVKLLDFGVSKFTNAGEELSMTKTGAVMGTPYYMSPEQARGQIVDHRSDLYSVGVVAYQCLTGRVPFNAETFNELIFKIALETPAPLENLVSGIDPGISAIVRRAMERDPNHRFQSASDFANAVIHWQASMGLAPTAAPSYSGQYAQASFVSGIGPSMSQSGGYAQAHASLSQSGGHPAGGLSQSNPQQMVSGIGPRPGFSQSGANLSGSNPQFSHSGAGGGLGASGALGHSGAMGTSGAMHPSGAMGASGAGVNPGMGQSQIGLAVTTGQSRKGTSIAIALGLLVLLGAAGVAAFMKSSQASTSSQPTAAATEPTATATATATMAATTTATASETAATAATPTADSTDADTATVATAEPSATQATVTNRVPTGRLPTKPTVKTAEPPKPPPPPPPTGGRSIDGTL